MILYISGEKIIAYSDELSPEEIQNEIDLGIAVVYDGAFDFSMGEYKVGMEKVFRWDGEKPVVEYIPINQPQPTQLDRIESAINELGAESLPISKVETAIMEGVNGI